MYKVYVVIYKPICLIQTQGVFTQERFQNCTTFCNTVIRINKRTGIRRKGGKRLCGVCGLFWGTVHSQSNVHASRKRVCMYSMCTACTVNAPHFDSCMCNKYGIGLSAEVVGRSHCSAPPPPQIKFRGQGIHMMISLRALRKSSLENISGPTFEFCNWN